jgi:hypothetical protein
LEDGFYDPRGWYDEVSVLRFIYDLWDTTDNLIDDQTGNEIVGAEPDNGSIGFGPIYDVMVGPQAFTETFTNIFSFASELRPMLPPGDQAFLDDQLVREDMTPGFDKWGEGELNDASPDGQHWTSRRRRPTTSAWSQPPRIRFPATTTPMTPGIAAIRIS